MEFFLVLIAFIINGVLWGLYTKKIILNKGLNDEADAWFWYGFFCEIFAVIMALSKVDAYTKKTYLMLEGYIHNQERILNNNNYNQERILNNNNSSRNSISYNASNSVSRNSSTGQQMMQNGGWVCSACNTVNASYVGSCRCGRSRHNN